MINITRKYLFVVTGLMTVGIVSYVTSRNWTPSADPPPRTKTYCYRHTAQLASLPSILDSDPARGGSIFFIETSCNSASLGKITLNARQACAIESAALQNPNLDIYVLFVSPGVVLFNGTESDRFLQGITSYRNVHLRHIEMGKYFKDTPVENLWTSRKVELSHYVYPHTSDVLRFLTLWKYGGIYLDLDVIVIKPLDLPLNFAGVESDQLVGSTVLSFEPDGNGHELVGLCLEDLHNKFDGNQWVNNGPGVITRLAYKICNKKTVPEVTGQTCRNFTFFPPKTFLPVPWNKWQMYFDENSVDRVNEMIKDSYSVHVWNNLNSDKRPKVSDKVPYMLLAQKYCPRVFREVNRYF